MISIEEVEYALNQITCYKQKLEEIGEIPPVIEPGECYQFSKRWQWSNRRNIFQMEMINFKEIIKKAQFERAYPMVGQQNIWTWRNLYDK